MSIKQHWYFIDIYYFTKILSTSLHCTFFTDILLALYWYSKLNITTFTYLPYWFCFFSLLQTTAALHDCLYIICYPSCLNMTTNLASLSLTTMTIFLNLSILCVNMVNNVLFFLALWSSSVLLLLRIYIVLSICCLLACTLGPCFSPFFFTFFLDFTSFSFSNPTTKCSSSSIDFRSTITS